MSRSKLSRQIERFSSTATILAPLCSKYNGQSVRPFMESAQVYNENFRSSNEFANLLRAHQNFLQGSISICNRLFDNYEPAKQASVYDWSRHFFNLLNASKKVVDEAYQLAYTVGRTDSTTVTLIEKEDNPLVHIRRKVIIDDADFETYKKTIFDWKCSIQAVYVEEQYMKHIVELCNARSSKFNPREVRVNTCRFRRTITIPDNSFESTPQICVLNAELLAHKTKVAQREKEDKLTIEDIDIYVAVYRRYQHELVAFVFLNFLTMYNETCVQCVRVFLEQQHSVMFNLLQKRRKLHAHELEKLKQQKRLDELTWSDIDKTSLHANPDAATCKSNSCLSQTKVVGSLE